VKNLKQFQQLLNISLTIKKEQGEFKTPMKPSLI